MGSSIKDIQFHLPTNLLLNDDIETKYQKLSADKIEAKLGIRSRHIASKDETTLDLAYNACEKLLEKFDRTQIDALILCTQSPEYFLPTTACILQNKLQLKTNILAFDFNLGCSGYVYGLAIADSFIKNLNLNNVLLVTSETYSKYISDLDVANKTIFGDGASATLLQNDDKDGIHQFIFGTDGAGAENLIVKNGASRHIYDSNAEIKTTASGDSYTDNNLFMNGPAIFNFTIERIPQLVEDCLDKNKTSIDEIDFVIFHQANKFLLDFLRKKLKIPTEKFFIDLANEGNTVSSTIPIAIKKALDSNMIKKNDKVLLCGFGVGYSWAATIITI